MFSSLSRLCFVFCDLVIGAYSQTAAESDESNRKETKKQGTNMKGLRSDHTHCRVTSHDSVISAHLLFNDFPNW